MNDDPNLTAVRPLPQRRNMRRGSKVKWMPTSIRLPPDLHKWLKEQAITENVDMGHLLTELAEQYRAFITAKKIRIRK